MPVLSEQPHHRPLSNLVGTKTTSYILLGAVLFLCVGVVISRRKRAPHPHLPLHVNKSEKPLPSPSPPIGEAETVSAPAAKARIPRPAPGQGHAQTAFTLPLPLPGPPSPEMGASSESFEPLLDVVPRRRSYTKNMPDGAEVSGEIVVAEGWRRHTRVFGGGVCKACEESERKLSA
jgi:hypothetical protein